MSVHSLVSCPSIIKWFPLVHLLYFLALCNEYTHLCQLQRILQQVHCKDPVFLPIVHNISSGLVL